MDTLLWVLFLFIPNGFCEERINCQWGPYGEWSECDGCTKLQTRSRVMAVYAQFGGNPCSGGWMETRPCETTKDCPPGQGCEDWFRCLSGQCISQTLVCNGDLDCDVDGFDEVCNIPKHMMCTHSLLPPNIDLLGLGFDVVTRDNKAVVINTKSFGGQCHTKYSFVHRSVFRLPLSFVKYKIMRNAQTNFSDEIYSSRWHYAKTTLNRQAVSGTTGYFNFDESVDMNQAHKVMVLKSYMEVAQFQSNAPQYIPISEEFWMALLKLPSVYEYAAYKTVLETFGTHYLSEGSLGGSFETIATINGEAEKYLSDENHQLPFCDKSPRWKLFLPTSQVDCRPGRQEHSPFNGTAHVAKVIVKGGQITDGLRDMQPDDPEKNWEKFANWAQSIQSLPQVIKQQLRPLSELVKEVQCAGVKKLHLRRATEEYISERNPCHCQPCRNNGVVFMEGKECKCICKPGTSGPACEQGADVGGQHGVIDGGWTCWSTWTPCSGNLRRRTRACSNPIPQEGGQQCFSESVDTSNCEDDELQHLMTTEPECFDQTLKKSQKCGAAPALVNGHILNPKAIYPVGSRIEYRCTEGLYLFGPKFLECMPDRSWSDLPGMCTRLQS